MNDDQLLIPDHDVPPPDVPPPDVPPQAASRTPGSRGTLRASDADRDSVAERLNKAFSEGRLSKDEYDSRLESAFSARTYADLDQVLIDLPAVGLPAVGLPAVGLPAAVTPVTGYNSLAIASLACGIAQFMVGPLATIPAIVCGHMARRQIRRSGEQGAGLALAGLMLGWAAVILGIFLLIVGVAMSARMQATMR